MENKMLHRFTSAGLVFAFLISFSFCAWPHSMYFFLPPGSVGAGEQEMKALAHAYPVRISQVAMHDGDWAVEVDGEWFFWAHGRILPEPQRTEWKRYLPRWDIYNYSIGTLPPIPQLDAQAESELNKMLKDARLHPPRKSDDFLNRLFDAGSRRETKSHLVTVDFLGFPVSVHQRIAGALQSVAAECLALRQTDPQVAAFFKSLAHIEGYSYRDVTGTHYRSYHSYGLAVDLIPKSYGGKAAYWHWNWVMHKSSRWWTTPYTQRWMVPLSIVSAFERNGFIWGGKWMFFDNMHFVYRPEILSLAREQMIPPSK